MENSLEEIIDSIMVLYILTFNIILKVKKTNGKWIIYREYKYESKNIITISNSAGSAGNNTPCYYVITNILDENCPIQNSCQLIMQNQLQHYLCSVLDDKFHLK